MVTFTEMAMGVFLGGAAVVILAWFVARMERWRRCRNLASAFVGEIASQLSVLETCESSFPLDRKRETTNFHSPPKFPAATIYESNSDRLVDFESPIPLEIVRFYCALSVLRSSLADFPLSAQNGQEESGRALARIANCAEEVAQLGERLLREFGAMIQHRSTRKPRFN